MNYLDTIYVQGQPTGWAQAVYVAAVQAAPAPPGATAATIRGSGAHTSPRDHTLHLTVDYTNASGKHITTRHVPVQ